MQRIEMVRLIADEGKELVKGDLKAACVDTFADKAGEWTEVVKEKKPQSSLTGLTAPLEGSLEQGGE